ncbi:hypothetical protein JW964_24885 [candidate division KSB1 bacterium]|nr:hypothetical protein [candidate division KSB1 bacterium]
MNLKIKILLTSIFLISWHPLVQGNVTQTASIPLLNLDYQVKIDSNDIKIDLDIQNFHIKNRSPYLVFYIGNIKLKTLKISSDLTNQQIDYQIQKHILFIGPLTGFEKKLTLHYTIQPGYLAKHGHQGHIDKNYCLLAGEQFLILPTAGRASRTQIHFVAPENWQTFLPPIVDSNYEVTKNKITTTDTNWTGFYQLVKNCYIFGKFSASWDQFHSLNFIFSKTISDSIQKKVQNLTTELIQFFNQRFQQRLSHYSFCFADFASDSEKIMGGVGPFSMGFTFSPHKKRDWQLLSHRLFHVYFDRFIGIKSFHLPPDLWFLEGMATFYEILAPGNLRLNEFGIKSYSDDKEFCQLYQRYLYFRLKDPELFKLIPTDKIKLSSAQIEFLHYTQAPLLILAIQEISAQNQVQTGNDVLWQWLQDMKSYPDTTLEAFISARGESALQKFWQNFIAGDSLLPPGTILPKNVEKDFPNNSQEIMHELKEYENLLFTWFQDEPEKFLKESIFESDFFPIVTNSDFQQINFANPNVEKLVFDFSPTIFYSLKINRLRLHVCKIDPTDPIRNFKLSQPENQEIWNTFLKIRR